MNESPHPSATGGGTSTKRHPRPYRRQRPAILRGETTCALDDVPKTASKVGAHPGWRHVPCPSGMDDAPHQQPSPTSCCDEVHTLPELSTKPRKKRASTDQTPDRQALARSLPVNWMSPASEVDSRAEQPKTTAELNSRGRPPRSIPERNPRGRQQRSTAEIGKQVTSTARQETSTAESSR